MTYRSRNSDDHFLYQNMVQLVYTVRCCKPFQSIQICVNKLHRILHPKNEFYPKMKKLYTCTHTSVIQDVVCRVCRTYWHQSHRGCIFSTWHVILTHYTDFCFRILVFVVGNSNTLQLLKLWFEQATIIEAMVSQY